MTEFPLESPSRPLAAPVSPPFQSCDAAHRDDAGLEFSRRHLLLLGAVGAAVLALPALPARALDLGMASELKFLENVQYLQNQFFSRALMSASLDDLSTSENAAIRVIANEDGEQARWFGMARRQAGLMPRSFNQPASLTEPTFSISASSYAKREPFFQSAIAIKEAAIGAYHGLVGAGGKPEMVQALAALAGVQNRHAAMLKEMAGQDPFVTYVPALSLQEASQTLGKFGFGTEINR